MVGRIGHLDTSLKWQAHRCTINLKNGIYPTQLIMENMLQLHFGLMVIILMGRIGAVPGRHISTTPMQDHYLSGVPVHSGDLDRIAFNSGWHLYYGKFSKVPGM